MLLLNGTVLTKLSNILILGFLLRTATSPKTLYLYEHCYGCDTVCDDI